MLPNMQTKRNLGILLIAAAVLASGLALTAWAVKPDKPPKPDKPDGETLTGTIYFSHYDDATDTSGLWTMNPDGKNKTPLPLQLSGMLIYANVASNELHGGHRWFLQQREVLGCYPDDCFPDGSVRFELFAVRDDGNVIVKLTDDGVDRFLDLTRVDFVWAVDAGDFDDPDDDIVDGLVSFIAQRWALDTETQEWFVYDAGIYAAAIEFDENGNVKDQLLAPELLVEGGVIQYELGGRFHPDITRLDWAPDGTRIVYAAKDQVVIDEVTGETEVTDRGLSIVNLLTGLTDQLTSDGSNPYWSPDGTKIAFGSAEGIDTINIDGTDRQTIVEHGNKGHGALPPSVRVKSWSPTGSHLLYDYFCSWPVTYDIYRVRADGEGAKNLTSNTDGNGIAWR